MKPYPLCCWFRAMILVSMPAIPSGPPGVPWAARPRALSSRLAWSAKI